MKKIVLLSLTLLCMFSVEAFAGHGHGHHWRRHYNRCDDGYGYRGGYVNYNNYYVAPPVRYVAPPPPVVYREYYAPQPAFVPVYPQNSISLQFGF
jgi:hypothetical protein